MYSFKPEPIVLNTKKPGINPKKLAKNQFYYKFKKSKQKIFNLLTTKYKIINGDRKQRKINSITSYELSR